MPQYEVKYTGNHGWEEISDMELMEELYRHYDRVTPAIKKMIDGNILQTANAIYRLKWKGGDYEVANPTQELNESETRR
jgi:hypothetical protein